MEKKASRRQYPSIASVMYLLDLLFLTFWCKIEFDFNLIVSNAVIYNNHNHPINREARKLFHAAKSVFSRWSKKAGGYLCKTCTGESKADDPLLICDFCCQSIHQICFLKPGTKALVLWSQEILHPLRGDLAFFCSDDCQKQFRSTCTKFRFPSTSVLSSGTESMFPPSKGVPGIDGLENSLENIRPSFIAGIQNREKALMSSDPNTLKSTSGGTTTNPDHLSEHSKARGTTQSQKDALQKLTSNKNASNMLPSKISQDNNSFNGGTYGIKAINVAKQNMNMGMMQQGGNATKVNSQNSSRPNEPYISTKLPMNNSKEFEKAQQAKYHASIRNLQVVLFAFCVLLRSSNHRTHSERRRTSLSISLMKCE
eukprot:137613-Hanusia_phi.AAC.4